MTRRALLAVCAVVACLRWTRCDEARPPTRFATFNIRNFPQHVRQIEGAFDEMVGLAASFIAVQEIADPVLFTHMAHARLGPSWQFAHLDTRATELNHHNGVLFDRRAWSLVATLAHDETRLGESYKPTLEVRLRPAGGGDVVRVLVVHLKSGSAYVDVRAQQLDALATIIRKSPLPTIVLGDYNATGERDRARLARLARETHLEWATEALACSAFWSREDGCHRSRLDHVIMTAHPSRVEVRGGCAAHGCEWEASCPRYYHDVSDHCPVVVTVE
ncbi:MAG: endonuclease/exonuclease/phosphatase family protein [Kofleriaceae bacterium]|nr:endonuclease/exonuclease/phosphatase family protein [Kofleriaceae bacterium]